MQGEVQTTSNLVILNNVFGSLTAVGRGTSAVQADCSAALISFVVFTTNTCTPGVTTAQNISTLLTFQQNASGNITNGVDWSLDYSHPLFGGDLGFNLSATWNMNYKVKGYAVNGVQFTQDSDALGRDNLLTGSGASPSQRWRGNASLRWSNDIHNVNLRANYISGMLDNRLTPFGVIINNPGATPDINSGYARTPKDSLMFDLNYIYQAPFWQDLELRASVINLLDKDPMSYQGSLGYYPGVGDPRGRIFELAATKKF